MLRTLRRSGCPTALLLLTLTVSAAAQNIRIFGRPAGPFQNYLVEQRWSQRELTVENAGDSAVRVKVACEPSQQSDTALLFSRIVELPPHSRRRLRLAMRPDTLRPGGRTLGTLPLTPLTYRTWDLSADRQLAPVSYDAAIVPARHTHVGVMFSYDSTPESDNDSFLFLQALKNEPLQDVTLMISSVRPDQQPPNHWFGYDGIDVLIVGRTRWADLHPAQRTALIDWTARGGVLVVTAGRQFHRVLAGELASAAGVEVTGEHRLESIGATDPDGKKIDPAATDWPVVFAELMPTTAEVLWRTNGLPLLTRNACGDGTIFVLATPLGAVKDPALHGLWQDVNAARRARPTLHADAFPAVGRDTLKEIAGLRAPGRIWPVALLAGLAAGSVATSLVLRRLGRSELTWVVLVPLCLLMAGAFFGWSRMRGNPERLSSVGLISQYPGHRSRVQVLSAYHSGSDGRENATFDADLADAIIRDVGGTLAGAMTQQEIRTDWTVLLPATDLPVGTSRALYIDASSDLAPIATGLTFGPEGLTGTIENRLPVEITGMVLYAGRRTYRMGPIPAGESAERTITDADRLRIVRYQRPERNQPNARSFAQGEYTGALTADPVDRLRNALLGQLMTVPGPQTRLNDRPILIAYTPHLPVSPIDDVTDARGWSVITCPLVLQAPPAGSAIRIPSGLTQTELDSLGTATWDAVRREFLVTPRNGKLLIAARFPRAIGPVSNPRATLRIDIRAMNNQMTVYGLPPRYSPRDRRAGGLVKLETFDDPSGLITFNVENIERFTDKSGRARFLLDVRRTGQSGESLLEAGTVPKWWLRSVDVTLEGQAGE